MEISKVLKNFRAEAQRLYGTRLNQIILYGSWARRNPTPDSDIDLALVLEGDVAPGREIDRLIDVITDINLEYGVLLSVYPVSRNDYQTINSPALYEPAHRRNPRMIEADAQLLESGTEFVNAIDQWLNTSGS